MLWWCNNRYFNAFFVCSHVELVVVRLVHEPDGLAVAPDIVVVELVVFGVAINVSFGLRLVFPGVCQNKASVNDPSVICEDNF